MRIAVGIILGALASGAVCCEVPPAYQIVAPDELISHTQDIVLAKVTNKYSDPKNKDVVVYVFHTVSVVKGRAEDAFQLRGSLPLSEEPESTFNNHSDPYFWKNYGGRLHNSPDCIIHPIFKVGSNYLVFREQSHVKSWELITSDTDKWLEYVRSKVGPNPSLQARRP